MVVFGLSAGSLSLAQTAREDDTLLRDKAFLLWEQGNQVAALPLLEKLAIARPTDGDVLERLAGALAGLARGISDPEERKQTVLRARSIFLRAKELGHESDYVQVMLQLLPEDGELTPLSARKEVDEALHEGEAAFGRADFAAALRAYERAFLLDPTSYEAALFAGDVYFNMNQMVKAGEWFSKAIAIDRNRETAYRYWGDGLMKEGKMEEARSRYIEAIVAEPYNRAPWLSLLRWARMMKATLAHPKIEPPSSVTREGGEVTVDIDLSALGGDGEGAHWLIYPMTRALWRREKFKKEFPDEQEYRHTLREEVEALRDVVSVARRIEEQSGKAPDADTAALAKLQDEGLLEAFVLLSRADEGIANDYPAYRATHRERLVRYLAEWVIQPGPTKD